MEPAEVYRFVPGSGGHLAVADRRGNLVLDGLDLRNEREALRAVEDLARERGTIVSVIRAEDGRVERIEARRPVSLNLSITPELDELLGQLAAELGLTKAGAVVKGIALLKAAADAKRRGKVIGAADSPESLETEFVGL